MAYMLRLDLLAAVQDEVAIWNTHASEYRDKVQTDIAWIRVVSQLREKGHTIDVAAAKHVWKMLRDGRKRALNSKSKSSAAPSWIYLKHMRFLENNADTQKQISTSTSVQKATDCPPVKSDRKECIANDDKDCKKDIACREPEQDLVFHNLDSKDGVVYNNSNSNELTVIDNVYSKEGIVSDNADCKDNAVFSDMYCKESLILDTTNSRVELAPENIFWKEGTLFGNVDCKEDLIYDLIDHRECGSIYAGPIF